MFQRLVLALGILVSAYISVKALTGPETVLSNFGLIVEGPNGRNEIRAQYGGFFGLVTIVMILSLFGRFTRRFGLSILLITVGGVLLGRVASLLIEGPGIWASYSTGIKAFFLADIILVVLSILALRQDSSE